jgi:hypothetical protein
MACTIFLPLSLCRKEKRTLTVRSLLVFALVLQDRKACDYHNFVLRGPRRKIVLSAVGMTVDSELRRGFLTAILNNMKVTRMESGGFYFVIGHWTPMLYI